VPARQGGEGAPAAGPELALTLPDAVRIALSSNLDLESEQRASEIARLDSLGSWGAFDPVLTAGGALSESESPGQSALTGASVLTEDTQELSTGLSWPHALGGNLDLSYRRVNRQTNNSFANFDVSTSDVIVASLTQPLLQGAFRRYATTGQREADLRYERQIQREREVRDGVVREVFDAYWDLVSAMEELRVRDIALELARQQVDQDRRRLEVGAGTEVDVLQAETNLAQREEERILAEADLRAKEDVLRRMIFRHGAEDVGRFLDQWEVPIRPLTPLPELDGVPPGVQALDWRGSLARALERRPELAQRRLELDEAEVRLEAARSGRLPLLDVSLSAISAGFDADPTDAFDSAATFEFPEYRGELSFRMPLGNRTAVYAERAAKEGVRNARLGIERQELDILADVRAATRQVGTLNETVAAAKKSLSLAERQLQAEQSRREIGLSTTFQVLEFQRDLAEALSTEIAARAGYAKAVGALVHAEGGLLEGPIEAWTQWDTRDDEAPDGSAGGPGEEGSSGR